MSDLKAQLSEDLADVEWSALIPHAQRDALIVVNSDLDLVEVGAAIANDNVSLVERWISEYLIHKPSTNELSDWNAQPNKMFSTLIVQPYVIVSEL